MNRLLAHVLDAAGRAPSPCNTQPWLLTCRDSALEVRVSPERTLPIADPQGHETLHALGALVESVLLTLRHLGQAGSYDFVEEQAGSSWSLIRIQWRPGIPLPSDPDLYPMIPIRRTSRLPYAADPIPRPQLDTLVARVPPPFTLRVMTDTQRIDEVRRLAERAALDEVANPVWVSERCRWTRFTPRDRRWRRDGLSAACLGWGFLRSRLIRLLVPATSDRVPAHLRRCIAPQAPPAPALCLLATDAKDRAHHVEAGRVLQRVWLGAMACGLATHPINAAIHMESTRLRVMQLFDAAPGLIPINLFRLGQSSRCARSSRLPVDSILAPLSMASDDLGD